MKYFAIDHSSADVKFEVDVRVNVSTEIEVK